MSPSKSALIAVLGAVLAVSAAGCWNPFDPPDGDDPPESQYYEFCDSAYKVIANLQYAYMARDIDLYTSCFRDNFEFHLLQVDWADYNGDSIIDTYWGLDLEEAFTQNVFDNSESIVLTFDGTSVFDWTGAPPESLCLELPRGFDLYVYTNAGGTTGFHATGTARFICRPDSTGEYYIYLWYDESEF